MLVGCPSLSVSAFCTCNTIRFANTKVHRFAGLGRPALDPRQVHKLSTGQTGDMGTCSRILQRSAYSMDDMHSLQPVSPLAIRSLMGCGSAYMGVSRLTTVPEGSTAQTGPVSTPSGTAMCSLQHTTSGPVGEWSFGHLSHSAPSTTEAHRFRHLWQKHNATSLLPQLHDPGLTRWALQPCMSGVQQAMPLSQQSELLPPFGCYSTTSIINEPAGVLPANNLVQVRRSACCCMTLTLHEHTSLAELVRMFSADAA